MGIEGVVSSTARSYVVRFIDDEDVKVSEPRLLARVGYGFPEDSKRILALQIVHRRDQARKVRPRIRVEPTFSPELFH